MSVTVAVLLMVVCFAVLTKCADWFVDGAVGIAQHLNVPKMLIGILLVSLATTAPELAVSVLSALQGHPEMALGNAVGSVIVDDTIALGLGAMLAAVPIAVNPHLLRTTGIFLLVVDVVAYLMAFNGVLGRSEGAVLLLLFAGYMFYTYRTRAKAREDDQSHELTEIEESIAGKSLGSLAFWFVLGLIGVLLASEGIVKAAIVIAEAFQIGEAAIALTVVAIGTSLPEIATGVMAARRGHGEIIIGNILGADILNICWIAGASAVLNPLVVEPRVIHFMFPTMLFVVVVMLVMMRTRHQLSRKEGIFLTALYLAYLVLAGRTLL